jgi:hypothetical protein
LKARRTREKLALWRGFKSAAALIKSAAVSKKRCGLYKERGRL